MQWEERNGNSFADAAFAFEDDQILNSRGPGEGDDVLGPDSKKFPFMFAMAYPHSAFLKAMVSASAMMGSKRDRIFYISKDITQDVRVVECMVFYMYTGLLVDIHTMTEGGNLSITSVLTRESVANAEFSFDLLVS